MARGVRRLPRYPPMDGGAVSHAKLSPSSASRWFACPGSVKACEALPPGLSSPHAAEGSVAHSLLEQYLEKELSLKDLMAKVGSSVTKDGHEIEITDDMVSAVLKFSDIVQGDAALTELELGKTLTFTEKRVRISEVAVWGTADYILCAPDTLKVYDFKYGKGVVVDPVENKQMALYALGVIDSVLKGKTVRNVELVIIQPRAGGETVRRWTVPVGWLQSFRKALLGAVEAVESDNAPRNAGSWCRWCAAKATCSTAFEDVQKQAAIDFAEEPKKTPAGTPLLPDIKTLPLEVVTKALEHEEYVRAWFDAVKDHVRGLLEAGVPVPGYKLVEGRSNRRYTDEAKVAERFEPVLGSVIFEPRKLLSPAKLEKIVGKGKLSDLTYKPEGAKTVVKEEDARPALPNSAAQDFAEEVKTETKKREPLWPV